MSEIGISQLENMDEIDLFILEALRKDGRVAFSQIAEQLKVSPGMIRQRYNRLVEMGHLKVVAITNPLLRGQKTMASWASALTATKCWRSPTTSPRWKTWFT